jgi:hypothetical protein
MLSWRDIVLYSLGENFPKDIVSQITLFLRRESICYLVEESRDYHVYRMPSVIKEKWPIGNGYYHNVQINSDCEDEVYFFGEMIDEFTDKWFTIDPQGKEYTYTDCWRWDRFNYPYMNFIPSFNRGRIFLRLHKGYERYDLNSEDNIIDKLTDYKELK